MVTCTSRQLRQSAILDHPRTPLGGERLKNAGLKFKKSSDSENPTRATRPACRRSEDFSVKLAKATTSRNERGRTCRCHCLRELKKQHSVRKDRLRGWGGKLKRSEGSGEGREKLGGVNPSERALHYQFGRKLGGSHEKSRDSCT